MEQYHRAVLDIARQVKSFHERKIPFRVYHGSTNSTRQLEHAADRVVDTSALAHVLRVDGDKQTALVEANVPMDRLVAATLAHGFIPLVVPEFPGITAGGSYAGTAAESSSFRYGFFDRAVAWIEVVLANGDVVRADPDANADLFYGAVGACGSLGVVTLLELRLVPAARYVALTYVPVYSAEEALRTINEAMTEEQWDFVDGILFSQASGVVLLGRLTETAPEPTTKTVRFSRRQDPWFFMHVHTKLSHQPNTHCETCFLDSAAPAVSAADTDTDAAAPRPRVTELVPTQDYLFRYDRGAFWMGSYGWPRWLWHRAGRYILDAAFHTRALYRALHHSGRASTLCIQDVVVPVEHAAELLSFVHDRLRIYPLWLCPVRSGSKAPLHRASGLAGGKAGVVPPEGAEPPAWLLNMGIWGMSKGSVARVRAAKSIKALRTRDGFAGFVADNRALEAKVSALGGLKWLYAQNWYTEAEFWDVYDRPEYEALRRRWGAEGLPSLWDKVRRRMPVEGEVVEKSADRGALRGVVACWLGRDYVLRKA